MNQPQILQNDERNRYWTLYEPRRNSCAGKCRASFWYYFGYRWRRWSGSSKLLTLQVLFVLGIVANAAGPVLGATKVYMQEGEIGWWIAAITSAQAFGAVAIWAYKAKSAGLHGATSHEKERRQTVASLIARLIGEGAVASGEMPDPEGPLKDICRCISWDMQEHFQITEAAVSVAVLVYRPKSQRFPGGAIEIMSRDRATDRPVGTREYKPALASYAYEAVRCKKAVVFDDVRDQLFKRFFPDRDRDYRSVVSLPISRPGRSSPYGAITINLRYPYILAGRADLIDRRLSTYVQLANLYLSGDDCHADAQGNEA